jgi:hypothetical protein
MRIPIVRGCGNDSPIAWWEWLFAPIVYPLFIVWIVLMAIISVPYFWLYPENHMNCIDLDGTDEEMRQLADYRAYRARIGLLRRLKERLKLVPFDAPPKDGTS